MRASSAVLAAVLAAALAATGSAARAQAPPPPAAAPVPAVPVPAPGAAPAVAAPAPAGGAPALLVPGAEFRYDGNGRRDPFKSLLQLEAKKRDITTLPPIQQFDLESAKVVGIVVDPVRGAQAMIRAPSGQTFVVRKGTIVGKNDGEVVDITLKGILVVEKFLDFMNRETRKETFLKSHPAAGR